MPELELLNLTKKFNRRSLFKDLKASLSSGKINSLMGSNGSGKTTLLRLIAGLEFPDAGSIVLNNIPISLPNQQLIAGDERIHLMGQVDKLMPNSKLADQLQYAARKLSHKQQTKLVRKMIGLFQLTPLLKKTSKTMSPGEIQRCQFALALIQTKEVLLMDEPFASLDPPTRDLVMLAMQEFLTEEDLLVFFSTHHFAFCEHLADSLLLLDKKKIVQVGTPNQVYFNPATVSAGRLTGIMNQLNPSYLSSSDPDKRFSYWLRPEHIKSVSLKDARCIADVISVTYSKGINWVSALQDDYRWQLQFRSKNQLKARRIGIDFEDQHLIKLRN